MHRTLAAMLAAFLSIGTLAALGDRPTMHEIVNWIDSETLLLIFSMMAMVAVLMETGVFEYVAVCAFQVNETLQLSIATFVRILMSSVQRRAHLEADRDAVLH